jgi:dihydrofolate reductase
VVSRNTDFQTDGAQVFSDLQLAIETARQSKIEKVFIIGGAQIYSQALKDNLIDEMFLTHIDARFDDADVFFPELDETNWDVKKIGHFAADANDEHSGTFFHYRKRLAGC